MEEVRVKVRRLELTKESSPLWGWDPFAPFTILTISSDTIEFPPHSIPARNVQSAVAYSVKLPGLGRIPWTIALRLRTQDGIYDLLLAPKVFRSLHFPFLVRHDEAQMFPLYIDRAIKVLLLVLAAAITLFILSS
ncbi:MAG: hypothetical protein ACE5JO_13210 [Candidatus Binatia bacterium]